MYIYTSNIYILFITYIYIYIYGIPFLVGSEEVLLIFF